MKGALLLQNGEYINDFQILAPIGMRVKVGKNPTYFDAPEGTRVLVEKFTQYQHIEVIPEPITDKRMKRQITNYNRLLHALKKESNQPRLNTKKIDSLKSELENVAKNIRWDI